MTFDLRVIPVGSSMHVVVAISLLTLNVTAEEQTRNSATICELAEPVRLQSGGEPISVDGFASPFYADIDGDGLKDLLVGQLDYGRLRIYSNQGTSEAPEFDGFDWFEAGGKTATVPTGCAVGFTPHVIDFDQDGNIDILTGSFYGGVVFVFRGRGGGKFESPVAIQNQDGSIQLQENPGRLQYNSTVFARDWDHDGDLDLILGRAKYQWVENIGTATEPQFAAAQRIRRDGESLDTGRVAPVVADWDGDGRDDLICGRGREVVWYQGVGMSEQPEFAEPQVLVSLESLTEHRNLGQDSERMRPTNQLYSLCVTDFNGDGRLDLLVGDHYYESRELSDRENDEFDEAQQIRSGFWQVYADSVMSLDDAVDANSLTDRLDELLSEWHSINTTPWVGVQSSGRSMRRFGGVWFYERLAIDEN